MNLGEDVDWENRTISFTRKKIGVPVILHLGEEALNTLKDLRRYPLDKRLQNQRRPVDCSN